MASVTRSRFFGTDPETVEGVIADDIGAFMQAGGYDSVSVEGDRVEIERRLGLANLSLTLRPIDVDGAVLAFEQESGLFEEMTMYYAAEPTDGGTELEARTEFTLGGVTGNVLDDTVIRRQRTSEIELQFDYVERLLED